MSISISISTSTSTIIVIVIIVIRVEPRPIVQHLRVREALGLWWRGGRRDAIAACNTHELRAALSQAPFRLGLGVRV